MAEANARLDFLWKASHLFLGQCPGASSHYMSQFLSLANSRDLRLHEDIQSKSCAACGSIFVSGLNSKVRVVPVNETKREKERSRKANRRKARIEKRKRSNGNEVDSTITTKKIENTSKSLKPALPDQQSTKKIIRIIPHTEQSQQQQQQSSFKNNAKKSTQLLNHIVYTCQRCNRETEIPGTKEEFLISRIKTQKPISQRRKLKKHRDVAEKSLVDSPQPNESSKRHAPSTKTPEIPNNKRSKLESSAPPSPAKVSSISNSMASSTASSPVSSPRHSGSDSSKLGNNSSNNNRKKKKGGLANLLASQQKPKDPPSDAAGGSGGDSVLANFLMGL